MEKKWRELQIEDYLKNKEARTEKKFTSEVPIKLNVTYAHENSAKLASKQNSFF